MPTLPDDPARRSRPLRVGFVLHVMQVAGAEVLVAEIIQRLGNRIEPVIFCLDDVGALGETLRREGVPLVTLGRKPGIDWACVRRFRREIQDRQPDVLHAHQYTPFFYTAMAARGRTGPRILFTEHGRHFPDVVSRRRRLFNSLFLSRRADQVTCVCQFSADALARNDGFRSAGIEIVPNGIDANRYGRAADRAAVKTRLGLDPARRYIACVARFHPVKDHQTLLSAFARLAGRLDGVDLLLVGDGQLRPNLERQAEDAGLTARVRFFGVRPDVPEILSAADVFTLASVSEAASITLLEAMASGLPCVVTNVGGNPELVRDRIDGLLVPRGDAAAMAAAFESVLQNPDEAAAMGRHAAERARREFDLQSTIDRYWAVFKRLAEAET